MKIILILVAVVVFLFLIYIALTFVAFNSFLAGRRKLQEGQVKFVNVSEIEQLKSEGKKWFLSQEHEILSLTTRDNLTLKGIWMKTSKPEKATAVLIHGYNGSPFERMLDAQMYLQNGFNVFIPYMRAHGESQGRYIGMGNLDSFDILEWLYFLTENKKEAVKLVLSGNSMGAATVATLTGNSELPSEVKAVVCDSSFTSISDEMRFVLEKYGKALSRQVEGAIEFWCKRLLKYDFKKNSPLENVKKSKTPTFFLHGCNDSVVSVEMTKQLFEVCTAPKELMLVENAGHCMSYVVEQENVTKRVLSFFEKYLGE